MPRNRHPYYLRKTRNAKPKQETPLIVEPRPWLSKNAWIARRRRELWEQQKGRCYWCGELTELREGPLPEGVRMPGKAATLDHLYSRLHPLRHQKVDGPRHVMACATCNGNRSRLECKDMHRYGRLTEASVLKPRAD